MDDETKDQDRLNKLNEVNQECKRQLEEITLKIARLQNTNITLAKDLLDSRNKCTELERLNISEVKKKQTMIDTLTEDL